MLNQQPVTFSLVAGNGSTHNHLFSLDANGSLKTLAPLDHEANATLSIRVRATDAYNATLEKVLAINVTNLDEAPTGAVTITGTATEGQVLTAANTLADPDGLGAITYQWYRDGAPIGGATNATYALTAADVGKAITVTASYTDGGNTIESVTSAPISAPVITSYGGTPTAAVNALENQTFAADVNATRRRRRRPELFHQRGSRRRQVRPQCHHRNTHLQDSPLISRPPDSAASDNAYVVEVNATDGTEWALQTVTVTVEDSPLDSATVAENLPAETIIGQLDFPSGMSAGGGPFGVFRVGFTRKEANITLGQSGYWNPTTSTFRKFLVDESGDSLFGGFFRQRYRLLSSRRLQQREHLRVGRNGRDAKEAEGSGNQRILQAVQDESGHGWWQPRCHYPGITRRQRDGDCLEPFLEGQHP